MPYVKSKARARPRRRYNRPKKSNRKKVTVAKLSRKVSQLSNSLKVEREVKFYTPIDIMSGVVGQVNANVTGAYVADMICLNTGTGVGSTDRVGNKVKLIGTQIRFQIQQQSACDFYNHYIVDVWATTDLNVTATQFRDRFYNVDSISGVIDANSSRQYDLMKKKGNPLADTWLVASKRVVVSKDMTTATQTGFKDFKMFIKQRDIVIYAGGATQVPTNIRWFCAVRAQAGNASTATASTLPNIVATAINTGAVIRFQYTNYFTDS